MGLSMQGALPSLNLVQDKQRVSPRCPLTDRVRHDRLDVSRLPPTLSLACHPSACCAVRPESWRASQTLHPKSQTPPGGGRLLPFTDPQLGWGCSFLEGKNPCSRRSFPSGKGTCALETLGCHQPASSSRPLMLSCHLPSMASRFCR